MAAEDYGDNLMRSRERLEKAGMYGSNQDLSLSSQSKVLQTQKRRWKATDADSKERKPSPHGDNLNEQPGGYGASFQDKQLFHGAHGAPQINPSNHRVSHNEASAVRAS